jgi:hypothetical protein
MGFFDQYKSINRSTITNAGKTGTRERLDESFANPQWKDDAIQVVKKLLEFKVEQSRDVAAERLLGGLTTPLERLNAKRRQAGADEIAARELHELVRNRSAIFKRQLPDTFKGLLRTWLRDGSAKAILVNTNTAAFLKSNDLITAAEVRTATPEATFSRQFFADDVAAMFNALQTAYDQLKPPGHREHVPKTACSSFTHNLEQVLKDCGRLPPSLREFVEPSVRNVIRTCARASAMGGLNREQLLQPQTAIGNVNSLTSLKRRIQKNPGHAWMAINGRRPMQTRTNWVTDGTLEESPGIGVTGADGTSLPVVISTGFGNLEWIQEARSLFGPAIFEFREHVSLADGLAAPGTRRSQQLRPDVEFITRKQLGSYASGFSELRGTRAFHFAAGPLDDRALDTFDMLVMLSVNQGVPTRALRAMAVNEFEQPEVPAVQIVNAAHPDLLPHPKGTGEITVAQFFTYTKNFFHYPIRISRHSREVQFLFHAGEFAIPGIAGAFWPYKYFTTRFDWCQRTNFVTRTMVDETPWKCSCHCPAWVPPSRGL